MGNERRGFTGLVYAAGSIIATSATVGSGWIDVTTLHGPASPVCVSKAYIRMVFGTVTGTSPTLDVDLDVAFDDSGTGQVKIHDFTQATDNTAQDLVIPGEDSAGILFVATTKALGGAIPKFWKFTWTIGGTATPTFPTNFYAAIIYG